MPHRFVLPLVFALSVTAAGVQNSLEERIARVERGLLPHAVAQGQSGKPLSIVERMTYHGIPGMSIAVIDDGRVAWARGYGVGSREAKDSVTPATLFQAASLSKPVSALGVMLLVQREQLSLDADARQWLRSWTPSERVTVRQLLSHSAGLTVDGFAGYGPGMPLPTTTQILKGESPANNEAVRVATPPGKEFRYSGGGYVAIQQIVTEVTGQSFDRYMRDAVFAPFVMSSSTFEQPLPAARLLSAATGHRRDGASLPGKSMVQPELAAAGLWTTPSDLAKLVIALQEALAGRATQLVTPATAREMLTAQIDNAGLGVFLGGPNGSSRRFTHTGRNAGFDAVLIGYKNGRQGAVVMINRNNNEDFATEILESIAREYHWPDFLDGEAQREYVEVPSSVQAGYAGDYEATGRPPLKIVFEDGKLFARAGEEAWFRLYPSSPTEFFAVGNTTRWTFVSGENGTIAEVVTRSDNGDVHRRRIR